MATKIRLKRQGKKFYAFYRVVVVDSRKKRDGKVIEEIGTYNPNTQPSTIQIKSDRSRAGPALQGRRPFARRSSGSRGRLRRPQGQPCPHRRW